MQDLNDPIKTIGKNGFSYIRGVPTAETYCGSGILSIGCKYITLQLHLILYLN
jgi:hypothetical protein